MSERDCLYRFNHVVEKDIVLLSYDVNSTKCIRYCKNETELERQKLCQMVIMIITMKMFINY